MAVQKAAPKVPAQDTIFRMDVFATEDIPAGDTLIPSSMDFDVSANIGVEQDDQVFIDHGETGFFKDFPIGGVFTTSGFLQPENNGIWMVVDKPDNNKVQVVDALFTGASLVEEHGAGNMFFEMSGERKKYRSFMFDKDLVVTFNNDATKTIAIPAQTPLYLTASMITIDIDQDARIYWSE